MWSTPDGLTATPSSSFKYATCLVTVACLGIQWYQGSHSMAPEQKVLMANAWEPNTEHREPSVWEPTNYQNEENQRTTSGWVIHNIDLLGNFSSTALYNVQRIWVHWGVIKNTSTCVANYLSGQPLRKVSQGLLCAQCKANPLGSSQSSQNTLDRMLTHVCLQHVGTVSQKILEPPAHMCVCAMYPHTHTHTPPHIWCMRPWLASSVKCKKSIDYMLVTESPN